MRRESGGEGGACREVCEGDVGLELWVEELDVLGAGNSKQVLERQEDDMVLQH